MLADMALAQFDRVVRADLYGPFLTCRRFVRALEAAARKGRIVNISSIHERAPRPGGVDYDAAKGGLSQLTATLALELAPKGNRGQRRGAGDDPDADESARDRGRGLSRAARSQHSLGARRRARGRSPRWSPSCFRRPPIISPAPPSSSTARCRSMSRRAPDPMAAYTIERLDDVALSAGPPLDGMDLMSPFVWCEGDRYRIMVRGRAAAAPPGQPDRPHLVRRGHGRPPFPDGRETGDRARPRSFRRRRLRGPDGADRRQKGLSGFLYRASTPGATRARS